MNKYEQSIVDRLRYASHHNQPVTLGADEVHIPMNDMEELDHYRSLGVTLSRLAEICAAEKDGRLQISGVTKTGLITDIPLDEIEQLLAAYKEGRVVVLPKTSEHDKCEMADFLHDCFSEWVHDPSVGLFGMTEGESKLANAIMQGFGYPLNACADPEAKGGA